MPATAKKPPAKKPTAAKPKTAKPQTGAKPTTKPAAKAAKPKAAKPAAKKATEKLPARQAAEVVLIEAGKPMHYREITKQVLERSLIKVKRGHKPEQTLKTIRSFLAGEVQKKGSKFVRVDSGVFDIRDRRTAKGAATAQKQKAASKP